MNLFSSSIGDVNLPFLSPLGLSEAAVDGASLVGSHVYNTDAQTATIVLTAADISGGFVETVLGLTGAITTAQNAQLPTVAALVAALDNPQVGQTYKLRVINVGGTTSGAFTLTTNTGWTLHGTMSIAISTWRDFIVTLTGANGAVTGATLQDVGTGVAP